MFHVFCIARERNAADQLSGVDRKCGLFDLTPKKWIWIYAVLGCWFYGFVLFDTLGDDEGFDSAWWALLLMGVLPLVLYAAYRTAVFVFPVVAVAGNERSSSSGKEEGPGAAGTHAGLRDSLVRNSVDTAVVIETQL